MKGDVLPGKTNNCGIIYKMYCNKFVNLTKHAATIILFNDKREGSNIYMAVIALKQKAIHIILH